MQKSQSAIEFIILASFMIMVMLGFFAVVSSNVLEAKQEGNRKTAEDIANFAYREIETAKSVSDGYSRVFVMPQTVNGINYSINIVDNRELVVNFLDNEFVKFLPSNVTGNISKGLVKISKNNGIVYINDSLVQPPQNLLLLIMKNNNFNVISFDNNGNAVLKGALQQNSAQQPTSEDEFIINDRNRNIVAVINLIAGNMFIKGTLQQSQAVLTPSPTNNNFVVKDPNGNVIAYIDETGNFLLKGALTQNGNP